LLAFDNLKSIYSQPSQSVFETWEGFDAEGNSTLYSDKNTLSSLGLSCLEPLLRGNDGDFDNMMILLDLSSRASYHTVLFLSITFTKLFLLRINALKTA
jgi:hypothetical protein